MTAFPNLLLGNLRVEVHSNYDTESVANEVGPEETKRVANDVYHRVDGDNRNTY